MRIILGKFGYFIVLSSLEKLSILSEENLSLSFHQHVSYIINKSAQLSILC
jgi:hypothetical protein